MYLAKSTNWGTLSRSNWNLEVLVFEERGNRSTWRKTSRSKDENQQQTQPTYDAESGNRTRATLVGGECSHHCAIPAALVSFYLFMYRTYSSIIAVAVICFAQKLNKRKRKRSRNAKLNNSPLQIMFGSG